MTVFLTLLAFIGVLVWLLGIVNKSVSKKSSNAREGRTEEIHEILKYGQFLDENELKRLGNPNCPFCHDNFKEFPKQSRTCKSCKAKLYVREIDSEKILIGKERNIEIRKMRDILREGFYSVDLPVNSFLPETSLKRLIDKLWGYLNSQLSPKNFKRNIQIRTFQAVLLKEEERSDSHFETQIKVVISDLSHILKDTSIDLGEKFDVCKDIFTSFKNYPGFDDYRQELLGAMNEIYQYHIKGDFDNQDKRFISFDFARFLQSNDLPYKSTLSNSKHYDLMYIVEASKSVGRNRIEISSCPCDTCKTEVSKKSVFTLKEALKNQPLPHTNCDKDFCLCMWITHNPD